MPLADTRVNAVEEVGVSTRHAPRSVNFG